MQTAFSNLTIKSFDDDLGIIRGIASTPATDRAGDIVEPLGASFTLPLALLHEHDRKAPLGWVTDAKPTPAGVEFEARIAKDADESISKVWRLVKAGLIPHVSVGFNPTDAEPTETGYRFKRWEWLELSLTTVPANTGARITSTKSNHGAPRMTIAAQIQQFETKRAEAHTRMTGIMTKAADEGRVLDEAETKAYDAAQAEVGQYEAHIGRLKALEIDLAKSAQPVAMPHLKVEDNTPKGTDFVKFAKSLALSKGNILQAVEIAKHQQYGNRVQAALKAAVPAGTTDSAEYAALVEPATMASEFIDLLRPATIVGKLTGLRKVPANIRIPRAATGAAVGWVGEAKASPVTNASFTDLEVGNHKLSAIVVMSEELLRRSSPDADSLLLSQMIEETSRAIDVAFIDRASAGVAGVKPASVANGVAPVVASGTDAAAIRTDVKAVFNSMVAANQPINGATCVAHPSTALNLSMMINVATGLPEFPGVTADGGSFMGLPMITSTSVPGEPVGGFDLVLVVQPVFLPLFSAFCPPDRAARPASSSRTPRLAMVPPRLPPACSPCGNSASTA